MQEELNAQRNGSIRYSAKELIQQLEGRIMKLLDLVQTKADRDALRELTLRLEDIRKVNERVLVLERDFSARTEYSNRLIEEFRVLQSKVDHLEVLANKITIPAEGVHRELMSDTKALALRVASLEKNEVGIKELRSTRAMIYTMGVGFLLNLAINIIQELSR